MPEGNDCCGMVSDVEHMLKIVVADIDAFDKFYKGLITSATIGEIISRSSMETIKETTRLRI